MYDNPNGLIIMGAVLLCMSTTVIGLRFLSRSRKGVPFLADDWLILASLVFAMGHTALLIYGCVTSSLGTRLQLPSLPPEITEAEAYQFLQVMPGPIPGRIQTNRKIDLSFFALIPPAICLIKCSVACLYGRIFVARTFRIIIGIWIVIIVCFGITFTVAVFTICGSRLSTFFEVNEHFVQKCARYWPLGVSYQSIDVALDIGTLLLPLPMIYKLQIPFRRKLTVIGIFMVGLVSLGASAGSAAIWLTKTKGEWQFPPTGDPFIVSTSIIVWNLVEIHSGILAACLPTLRPLLTDKNTKKNVGHWFGLVSSRSRKDDAKRKLGSEDQSMSAGYSRNDDFDLCCAGENRPTTTFGTHDEGLPSDVELASNEYYMRREVEVFEHPNPPPKPLVVPDSPRLNNSGSLVYPRWT